MAYYDFLNIIFFPLLKLPTLWAVIILSFIVSLITILVTKYMTDQSLMKKLRDELKEHQNKIKELKKDPVKAMEMQKKAMEVNMKYMSHSLKPTLITFIPIILIFGWASSAFAYEHIRPQQEFSITVFTDKGAEGNITLNAPDEIKIIGGKTKKIGDGKANWSLNGREGEHVLEFIYNGEKQQKNVLVTNENRYMEPVKETSGMINQIKINYHEKKLLNLFGWKLGWLGTYIIFSIAFTMALRKLLKVY